jgi:hypothetical protein
MTASNAPPDATIVRPCFRMSLDLCESSARGTAIRWRSSSESCRRSTSRSDSASSFTPRNAKEMYQSQITRRKIREKKSSHSSSAGTPGFASRGGGVGCAFCRSRESSMKSPDSSNSGRLVSASTASESMPISSRFGICSGSWSRFSAAFASSVSP